MPDVVRDRLELHPSRAVRWLTWIFVSVGTGAAGLYGSMALLAHFTEPELLASTLLVAVILIGRPLASLGGRTVLDSDGITARRPPARILRIPYAEVTWVEVRQGPLREVVTLHRSSGLPVRLRAPVRLWFRRDPEFERGVAEICSRTGLPACAERFHLGLTRLVAAFTLTAAAVMLILIDPPWKSDVWPFQPHARALPDTCRIFDTEARRLMPRAEVDRAFSGSTDDGHVERHACRWRSAYAPNGIRSLSVEYQLDHGIGPESDADEAHQAFRSDTHTGGGERSIRIPRTGDEARMITAKPDGSFEAVIVAARKANVEEKIEFVLQNAGAEGRVAAMAKELARTGLAEIRFV